MSRRRLLSASILSLSLSLAAGARAAEEGFSEAGLAGGPEAKGAAGSASEAIPEPEFVPMTPSEPVYEPVAPAREAAEAAGSPSADQLSDSDRLLLQNNQRIREVGSRSGGAAAGRLGRFLLLPSRRSPFPVGSHSTLPHPLFRPFVISQVNGAPIDFPAFIREGYKVRVLTSNEYVSQSDGLVYKVRNYRGDLRIPPPLFCHARVFFSTRMRLCFLSRCRPPRRISWWAPARCRRTARR